MNKLSSVRKNNHYTQLKLARTLGVSQKTISSWEVGRTTPSAKYMQQIEDLFNVPKEEIFFNAFSYKS